MKLIITSILLLFSLTGFSQKWVSPNFTNHRLDFRDLGYPGVNEIPADDSRISALLTSRDGHLYGATSGSQSYLFVYDKYLNKVRPLGQLPGSRGVHHTMVEDLEGNIYMGTGMNLLGEIPLTQDIPGGHRQIEHQLWKDIKHYHQEFSGGKIYRFNPSKYRDKVYLSDNQSDVEDMGTILKNNSIYTLDIDKSRQLIYGITYPDAHFFRLDIRSRKVTDYGTLMDTLVYSGPERSWRSVPRALLCLDNGKVLTAAKDGLIAIFNPETGKMEYSNMRIPGEYWESWNYIGFPVVEQLIRETDTIVWGSTSDGFLFRLDLENKKITDLGKPRVSRRIRAMTHGKDGNLYLIAGELGEPCKLYSYNTNMKEGFRNWSYLSVDRSPYYQKRAYQFEAMATGIDGTIFIGESDRRGKLFLFLPGGELFNGGLNPKNPR